MSKKSASENRVVITGLGAVSPFGRGVGLFFDGLRAGRSGLRRVSLFEDLEIASQVAGEVPDYDPALDMEALDLKRVPRVVPMAIAASREAVAEAGIDLNAMDPNQSREIGIVIGTGGGGIEFAERRYEEFFAQGNRRVSPYSVSSSFVGMLSSEISIALGLRGPSHVLSTGCTSSTDAMGYAYRMIRSGYSDILLSGGAEACITRGLMAGFSLMKVVSARYNDRPEISSRPFDRERDGFVLGEGAWMFVMESLSRARARGAKILAEVTGYGSTCEAFHRVAAKPDGIEPARAMKLALDEAGISPDACGLVNLHGTATKMNDAVETKAVKLLFNKRALQIPTTALKSMIGHPQGACGAAGVMSGIFSIREQFIPPTINYENPDPECDLNITPNKGVARDVEHVLCNTIAFGSKNSALLLSRVNQV